MNDRLPRRPDTTRCRAGGHRRPLPRTSCAWCPRSAVIGTCRVTAKPGLMRARPRRNGSDRPARGFCGLQVPGAYAREIEFRVSAGRHSMREVGGQSGVARSMDRAAAAFGPDRTQAIFGKPPSSTAKATLVSIDCLKGLLLRLLPIAGRRPRRASRSNADRALGAGSSSVDETFGGAAAGPVRRSHAQPSRASTSRSLGEPLTITARWVLLAGRPAIGCGRRDGAG